MYVSHVRHAQTRPNTCLPLVAIAFVLKRAVVLNVYADGVCLIVNSVRYFQSKDFDLVKAVMKEIVVSRQSFLVRYMNVQYMCMPINMLCISSISIHV